MAEIELKNVSKRFGETVAVGALSLTIRDGEFFCVFGPPSSGKTTLLRLILGLETPDEGEIRINGRDASHLPPAARDIAMVFQNLALFPHMTARDNIRFPLVERGVQTIDERVSEVVQKLHIDHILHKPPAQLSGGERQRVAIARALVRDPVAFLMDDPISALDARLREEARVELRRIQRELGRTFVYVTHDQEEAMSVADRMAILENGAVQQIGSPFEIYDHPASRYVALLVGSPPMNLIPGLLDGATGRFATDGGKLQLANLTGRSSGKVHVDLGVRPEDLRISDPRAPGAAVAIIYEVEPLGGFSIVNIDHGGRVLRSVMRGQPKLKRGENIGLTIAPERVHLFRRDTGAALGRAS